MRIAQAPARIIADDLTGALDAAAPFAVRAGPLGVGWDCAATPGPEGGALDLGSRGLDARRAADRMAGAAAVWWRDFPGLAFKKVDSVWRGQAAAEIAAAMIHGGFGRAIVAPAFPGLGRTTRNGRQYLRGEDGSDRVVADLVADLRAAGLDVALADGRERQAAPVLVCDARDDPALDKAVGVYMQQSGRTLWCGSGGLATALARRGPSAPSASAPPARPGSGPTLVLIGSNHPVSRRQAERVASMPGAATFGFDPASGWAPSASGIGRSGAGTTLCRFVFAPGTRPADAQAHIRDALSLLVVAAPVPRHVVVAGGDTLRSLCEALGAGGLAIRSQHAPGFPVSVWPDGRWAGVPVTSKSGGFGDETTLVRLLSAPQPASARAGRST